MGRARVFPPRSGAQGTALHCPARRADEIQCATVRQRASLSRSIGAKGIDAVALQSIQHSRTYIGRAACHAQFSRAPDRSRQALRTAQVDRAFFVRSLDSHHGLLDRGGQRLCMAPPSGETRIHNATTWIWGRVRRTGNYCQDNLWKPVARNTPHQEDRAAGVIFATQGPRLEVRAGYFAIQYTCIAKLQATN